VLTSGESEDFFLTIKSAVKRAKTMGRAFVEMPEYLTHPLAACISNYKWIMGGRADGGVGENYVDGVCIYRMAKRINRFCDDNKISGDVAAQYWLCEFLKLYERLGVNFLKLPSKLPESPQTTYIWDEYEMYGRRYASFPNRYASSSVDIASHLTKGKYTVTLYIGNRCRFFEEADSLQSAKEVAESKLPDFFERHKKETNNG
jgi:hypothetical protein